VTAEATLDRLDDLLARERAAIRGLDSERTLSIAEEKAQLMVELGPLVAGRADLAERLRVSTRAMRDNCVLLAHARDCLRDALGSFAREMNAGPRTGARTTDAPPRRGLYVSVKG